MKPQIISFISNGHNLTGLLHDANNQSENKCGIILLSAGLKNMVGYGRLYVTLANFLSSKGYPTLRFDYHGCGNSEGWLGPTGSYEELHADINGFIQTGEFVDECLSAINLFKTKTGISSVVLIGLCGGSNTALLSALESKDVSGIIMLNLPIRLDSSLARKKAEGKLDLWQKEFLWKAYLRKIFSIKAWWRLITVKSNFRIIGKLIGGKTTSIIKSADSETEPTDFEFNDMLVGAFEQYFKSGRKAFLFFSENDSLLPEFEKYFEAAKGRKVLKNNSSLWEKYILKMQIIHLP